MAVANAVSALGSLALLLALVAALVSFVSPYWLGNVTAPSYGHTVEIDLSYVETGATRYLYNEVDSHRGLWAQCRVKCLWFWQHDYSLQRKKFTVLGWHLATQVTYSIAVVLLIVCEIYVRAQLCCGTNGHRAYRALGILLLVCFFIQVASLSVFGRFALRDYGVTGTSSARFTYFGWCYYLALSACSATFVASAMFSVVGFCATGPTSKP